MTLLSHYSLGSAGTASAGFRARPERDHMIDPTVLLDQLDAAHAAATPGPWRRNSQPGVIFGEGTDKPMPIAAGYTRPDAALIVAAVNSLPQLTAAVRAVLALADELDAEAAQSKTGGRTSYLQGQRVADAAQRLRTAVTTALTADPTNQEGTP